MWKFLSFTLLLLSSAAVSSSNAPWGPTNPVADPEAMVIVGNARFTVLTDRMIRMEYKPTDSKFEDRQTVAVWNRQLPVPQFDFSIKDNLLKITTNFVTLKYQLNNPFSQDSLQISGSLGRGSNNWTYHYGQDDPLNLLGTIRTLDRRETISLNCSSPDLSDQDHCEPGLISRSGFAIINDTANFALSSDQWWDGPDTDLVDVYILGHGWDYKAALHDFVQIGGKIPLLPRYALGVWFSRWYDFSSKSAASVVQGYEQRSIPLDVFVLDMNWHKKNDWTGYSWDDRLYKPHDEAVAYLKHRKLAVTLNLHDFHGVNKWETQYDNMCLAVGQNPALQLPVNFTVINATLAYALEDVVLQPLERDGVDFWWIDWQQGESQGGAHGKKQNPTIWLAHLRSNNAHRRSQNVRNMVLARWGGMGAHRYPVHFSGDATITWTELAFQPYFSMTATNVGAIWSHDITGKLEDPEIITRWIQWSVFSGVSRIHDKGTSAGGCATHDPETCTLAEPWKIPSPKHIQANADALRTRGALIPYLYTAAHDAHVNGRWFTTPLYYEWPHLEGAYQTASASPPSTTNSYVSQYLFGNDMWVAPVVTPANTTDGLARLNMWIPPGLWVGMENGRVVKGALDGSSNLTIKADLKEIPVFVRVGAVIPSIPVKAGNTIGLAQQQYNHLIWTVYLATDPPKTGIGIVYEDDGITTDYLEENSSSSAITTAQYKIATVQEDDASLLLRGTNGSSTTSTIISFAVSTNGTYQALPSERATTIRLTNTFPPKSVRFLGKRNHVATKTTTDIPFSRFGGPQTWSYDMKDAAVVIELASSAIADGIQVQVVINDCGGGSLDGFGYRIQRANWAKDILDEIRMVPGAQDGNRGDAYLLQSASSDSTLEYLAGGGTTTCGGGFEKYARSMEELLRNALQEVRQLTPDRDKEFGFFTTRSTRGLLDERRSEAENKLEKNEKVWKRLARAVSLLEDAIDDTYF